MSDYTPNPGPGPGGLPGGPYDPKNRFEDPRDPGGNGPYVLLAMLVAVAVIGGVVYFSHGNRHASDQTAQVPVTNTRPMEPLQPPGAATTTTTPALPGGTPGTTK
jgi:hypothetical protein